MIEITSLSQFNALKTTPLLIIDFYATWCGPCKQISPVFVRFSTQHSSSASVIFAQIDVDKAKDVAQLCGISAMPTFQFFRAGKKVDEVKGADVQQLTTKIGYYTGLVAKEGPIPTSTAGTKTGESKSTERTGPGSLRGVIDIDSGRLLGTTLLSSIRNIASPPPAGYALSSLSGPKILAYIPFTTPVIPSVLSFKIDSKSLSSAPSRITVGSNVPVIVKKVKDKDGRETETNDLDMDSSLSKAENTQAFNVFSDEYVEGRVELKLKASKFGAEQGVRNLVVKIEKNLGEEGTITKVGEVDVVGIKV
ncbi:thioredoxin [Diplocarpon rosae]|nr:thioredoxin [Diplocarpon rosae]